MSESPKKTKGTVVGYGFAVGITVFFLTLQLLHNLELPPNLKLLSNFNIGVNPAFLLVLLVVLLLFPGLRRVKLFGLELEKNVEEIRERTAEIQGTINTLNQSLSAITHAEAGITQIIGLPKETLDVLAGLARIKSAEKVSDKTMRASHKLRKRR